MVSLCNLFAESAWPHSAISQLLQIEQLRQKPPWRSLITFVSLFTQVKKKKKVTKKLFKFVSKFKHSLYKIRKILSFIVELKYKVFFRNQIWILTFKTLRNTFSWFGFNFVFLNRFFSHWKDMNAHLFGHSFIIIFWGLSSNLTQVFNREIEFVLSSFPDLHSDRPAHSL